MFMFSGDSLKQNFKRDKYKSLMEQLLKQESAFREVADIGVIWVIDEAAKLGFYNGNPDWANLGQGEPEVGEMPGAPPRITEFKIVAGDDCYGPVNGMKALRQAIAAHYNRLYRKGNKSQYTAANVSVAMGGRLALTRVFSVMGGIRLGFKVPEYPAYEDMINYQQRRIKPVCIPTKMENNYALTSGELGIAIAEYELDALLLSNPCNPTGHVIKGGELEVFVQKAKDQKCTLVIDEVYSHFIYANGSPGAAPVSSAAYIDDVNADSVLIVDALTKSFRYPGWRLAWVLGPESVIDNIGRAASGIDGGPSLPVQRAALQLFEPSRADAESIALREVFSGKRNIMLRILRESGMVCSEDADSTFYIWADISRLPAPLNDARTFFDEALKRKVIVVPGYLFNIQPGCNKHVTRFNHFVRFSFGPPEENMVMGLMRITELIQSFKL